MRAIKYYGKKDLRFIDIDKPRAGAGQVLVKVIYCGICGTDVHAYKEGGIFNWELIPGHETVGIVEETGSGVTCVKAGDRVAVGPPGDCGKCYSCNTGHPNTCENAFVNTLGIGPETQGAYAEYVLSHFPQNELFKIPDNVRLDQAVLFDVIGVGFHAVRKSRLKLGENAVVSGCGSIGLSIIQAAKMAGARNVIAFDFSETRRKAALAAGADYALSPESEEDKNTAKKILSHEGGAHVSFEAAGAPSSVAACVEYTMANGQVIIVGSDGRPYELISAAMGPKEYDLQFVFTYTKEEIHMLFEMISSGKWSTDVYSVQKAEFDETIEKIEALADGSLDVARVLIMPNGKEIS